MTDYSNMSRCDAVERCIGLEREVKRMAVEVGRIAESQEDRVNAAIQMAYELGGLDDGSYHLEGDEIELVIISALQEQKP